MSGMSQRPASPDSWIKLIRAAATRDR